MKLRKSLNMHGFMKAQFENVKARQGRTPYGGADCGLKYGFLVAKGFDFSQFWVTHHLRIGLLVLHRELLGNMIRI